MDKNQILNTLIEYKNQIDFEQRDKIDEIIEKIKSLNNDELKQILSSKNIYNIQDFQKFISNLNRNETEFKPLNNLIYYGISNDTINIHLIPKDARNLMNRKGLIQSEIELVDAIEKIRDIIQLPENANIKQIYAVSGLIKGNISKMFENIQFDVKTMKLEKAINDEELSHFAERFKDKKDLGRAVLPKEKLISDEHIKICKEHKIELSNKLKEIENKSTTQDYKR